MTTFESDASTIEPDREPILYPDLPEQGEVPPEVRIGLWYGMYGANC